MLPEEFADMLAGYGSPLFEGLPEALASGASQASLRINPDKMCGIDHLAPCGSVAWSAGTGFYLASRPVYTLDPRLHQGRYYVQEASSMIYAHIARMLAGRHAYPLLVADSCAAPGGKSTAVLPMLPEESLLVANEVIPSRAAVLRENIIKWGSAYTVVTRADTAALGSALKGKADIVIADVPCSGEGMMRKDADAVAGWSRDLIAKCRERQQEIVDNLWPMLRPGGYMIYSTCTFNRDENELMVDYLVDTYSALTIPVDGLDTEWGIAPGIDTGHHCYRFLPNRLEGEGLFVCLLQKPGELTPRTPVPARPQKRPAPQVAGWISDPDGRMAMLTDSPERITAFPCRWMDTLKALGKRVDILHEGVTLGHVKGRADIVPAHSLAMSGMLRKEAFGVVNVGLDEALQYLRGNAIAPAEGLAKGHALVMFDGYPLGFVKNLGTRTNNLYPKPYRIHSV